MTKKPLKAKDIQRVLDHFALEQPEEARLARTLLDGGGRVIEAWGPLQMAVWHLVIERGNWVIFLHSERGCGDAAQLVRSPCPSSPWDGSRPFGLAVFAWARANAIPFRLDTPDDIQHDLAAHACEVLDWLEAGNEPLLDRVYRVWIDRRDAPPARVVADMEDAALAWAGETRRHTPALPE